MSDAVLVALVAAVAAIVGSLAGLLSAVAAGAVRRTEVDTARAESDFEVGQKMREELRAESKRLRDEYTGENQLLQKEIDTLVEAGELRQTDIEKLRDRCAALEKERDRLEARYNALQAQFVAEQNTLLAERSSRVAAEALAAELAAKNNELSNECARMKERITALEAEVRDLRSAGQRRLDEPMQR